MLLFVFIFYINCIYTHFHIVIIFFFVFNVNFCFYLFFLQSGKRPVGFVIPTGRTLFQHFSHPQRLIYTHRILPVIAVHYSKRSKSFHRTGRLIFGLTIRFKYRWIKSIVIIVSIRAISVVSIRVQINIIVTVGFQETVITS